MNPLLIFGIILIIVIIVSYKMFVGRYDRRGVYEDNGSSVRKLSMEKAVNYLNTIKRNNVTNVISIVLFILCPVGLIGAAFLVMGIEFELWKFAGILWAVAGVLYCVVRAIAKGIIKDEE